MDASIPLAAIALVTVIIGAVVKPLFALLRLNTAATDKLGSAMERVATSNKDIARETKQGNKEAKERNGHLAELSNEGTSKLAEMLDKINATSQDTSNGIAAVLERLEESQSVLDGNTKLALAATERVASNLLVAADKIQTVPTHIDTQTVDHQVVTETTKL